MPDQTITREDWVRRAYLELLRRYRLTEETATEAEKKNLFEYAGAIAENFFDENYDPDMTPEECVDEDLCCF